MIYIIDHEDSFTFNLAHLLGAYDTVQVSNFYEINKSQLKKADMIVLSPGPGEPKNYPRTTKIYHEYKGKKKILGICLGFQQILFAEGGQIVQQKIFIMDTNLQSMFCQKVIYINIIKNYQLEDIIH